MDHCIAPMESEFSYMNEEKSIARGDKCREKTGSATEEAMSNLDCQGFLDAVLGQ